VSRLFVDGTTWSRSASWAVVASTLPAASRRCPIAGFADEREASAIAPTRPASIRAAIGPVRDAICLRRLGKPVFRNHGRAIRAAYSTTASALWSKSWSRVIAEA
jgi:hypothetical protein